MKFIENLKIGYTSYYQGIKFLIKNKLWYYFIFPLILSGGIYLIGKYFASIENELNQQIQTTNPSTLNELIWINIQLVLSDGLYIIFTKFTKYIVIVALAPVLTFLSEKIEEIITGNNYKFNLRHLWHDIRRGFKIAIRNILWEYFFIIIVLGLASLFPNDQIKATILFSIPMMIGFYYYGFGFIDYVNERRRLTIKESTNFVKKHRGLAFSIGSIYSIVFMIPYVGVVVSPIIAITAATLAMNKVVDLKNNEWAIKKTQAD